MILFNLVGGPGSGKTTLAYYLASQIGLRYRTEVVGEAARELIYNTPPGHRHDALEDNQVFVTGLQYERLVRLYRHGVEVAISDSPLRMGLAYCGEHFYESALGELVRVLETDRRFQPYNILCRRGNKYDAADRKQSLEFARALDREISHLYNHKFWEVHNWGESAALADYILQELRTRMPR